jgi:hypothetical protein
MAWTSYINALITEAEALILRLRKLTMRAFKVMACNHIPWMTSYVARNVYHIGRDQRHFRDSACADVTSRRPRSTAKIYLRATMALLLWATLKG